jgi:uncharacterized iron-regulated membrane protein
MFKREFKQRFDPPMVEASIARLMQAIKDASDPHHRTQLVAELQVALSERAEIASQRLENLTVWLSMLTVVLAVLTITLIGIAYRTDHNINKIWERITIQQEHQNTQHQETNTDTPKKP